MNVTAKVLIPFSYKGKQYKKGDEVSMSAAAAATHEKLSYIKLNSEAKEKVERVVGPEKKIAGPGKK